MLGSSRPHGFTLVELLVVVTIIVILLAMLVPAMNKAIYQATLVKCATNYKLLASASHTYAFDYKRWYPQRDLPREAEPAPWPAGSQGIQPHKLTHPGTTGSGVGNYDLRPMLRPYVSINAVFNDPFCIPMDYDDPEALPANVHLYTSIYYWGGWYYSGMSGIWKLGDRFEAIDEADDRKRVLRLGLLAGDIDTAEGSGYSSHPDNFRLQNQTAENAAWKESNWVGGRDRAPLDLNFAYEDGSVRRKEAVRFSWGRPYAAEGMARIANFNTRAGHVPSTTNPPRGAHVPQD